MGHHSQPSATALAAEAWLAAEAVGHVAATNRTAASGAIGLDERAQPTDGPIADIN
jgi:hypothetical protein